MFALLAIVLFICFIITHRTLKQVEGWSPYIMKELRTIKIFFAGVMVVFVLRGIFDLMFLAIIKTQADWGPFIKLMIQDLFYCVWDLPIVAPIIYMHHQQYKTPYIGKL